MTEISVGKLLNTSFEAAIVILKKQLRWYDDFFNKLEKKKIEVNHKHTRD